MTKENWTAEGVASGTLLTNANSDDGTPPQGLAFSTSIDATNAPVTYDNTRAKFGTQSLKFARVTSATGASYAQRTLVDGASARGKARQYWYFTANPTGEIFIVKLLNSAGSASGVGSVFLTAAGKIRIQDTAGSTIWTSTASIPLNAWFMLTMASAPGSTTTTGALSLAFYNAAGTKLDEYVGAGLNLGTNPTVQYVRFGRNSADTSMASFWVDDAATDSGDGYIAAEDVTPPTGTSVEHETVKTIDARTWVAGSGGGPMAYSLSLVSGPAITYREIVEGYFEVDKHTSGLPTVVRVTGTDAGGGTKTADYTIPVATSGVSYAPFIWVDGIWK